MVDTNDVILQMNKNICQQLDASDCDNPEPYFELDNHNLFLYSEHIPRMISLSKKEIKPFFCDLDITHLMLPKVKLTAFPACKKGSRLTTTLEFLDLRESNLNSLPKAISNFQQLKYLDLNNNKFTEIPEEIFTLEKLKTLYLYDNEITTIPDAIKELDLEDLSLTGNNIKKLPNLDGLLSLKSLDAKRNQIQTFPELSQTSNLEHLDLSDNRLEEIPSQIKHLKNLTRLNLDYNKLKSIADVFHRDPISKKPFALEHLDLTHNRTLTSLPESFGELDNLAHLDITLNRKLTDIPEAIFNLKNLKRIEGEYVPFTDEHFRHIEQAQIKNHELVVTTTKQREKISHGYYSRPKYEVLPT